MQLVLGVDMAGRLVEYRLPGNVFLDKQIAIVAFNDGGHRQVRNPAHACL